MKIYIYQIWFPTSKKSYVGQTKNLEQRMQGHLRSGSLVCKALWKYNDWQIEILHTCKTRDEANRIEIEEIRHYNCVAPNGYNLTHGGEGGDYWSGRKRPEHSKKMFGRKASLETRKKLSNSLSGHKVTKEVRNKIANTLKGQISPFRNCQHTEEAKERNRQAHLGKKQSKETILKRRITQLKNKLK